MKPVKLKFKLKEKDGQFEASFRGKIEGIDVKFSSGLHNAVHDAIDGAAKMLKLGNAVGPKKLRKMARG